MKKSLLVSICISVSLGVTAQTSLKDAYQRNFTMGVAMGASHILEKDNRAQKLIKREFNSVTPENHMKCENIHPEWSKYTFEMADRFVEFGQKNKMETIGHTLIWHSQLSPFVHQIQNPDSLRLFMREHIHTIVGRYKGKVHGWDVVNEALEEDGSLRKSLFFKLLGEDYIAEAFRLAAEADPNAELYYNDYNIEQPLKRAGAISLIKKLQAQGIRIDGVGIQGHWSIKGLPLEEIEKSIQEFSALGIKVMFTELDITVLPNPWDLTGADVNQRYEANSTMNPYPAGLPTEIQNKLAQEYGDLFQLFRRYQDKITRVTFWGVEDGHSWLNGWPIPGRTNYPLLFDRNLKPKPAYYTVIQP